MLGDNWRALPGEEKKKYIEDAAVIKEKFSVENPNFVYAKVSRRKRIKTDADAMHGGPAGCATTKSPHVK